MSRRPSLDPVQQDQLSSALCSYIDGSRKRKRALVEALNVREGTLNAWIDGKRSPTKGSIPAICEAIGKSPADVFGRDNARVITARPGESRRLQTRGTPLRLDEHLEHTLSELLYEHMKAHDLTQAALAERLGVQQSYIHRWLRCTGNPTWEQLKAICRELGRPLSELFPYGHTVEELRGTVPMSFVPLAKVKRTTNHRGQKVLRIHAWLDVPDDDRSLELLRLLREAKADPLNN